MGATLLPLEEVPEYLLSYLRGRIRRFPFPLRGPEYSLPLEGGGSGWG